MLLPKFLDNPFQVKLSFHKLIERLEETAAQDGLRGDEARQLLYKVAQSPELRDGITDVNQLLDNDELISELLTDLFPPLLTNNEIKAISIPYQGLIFNHTKRFREILDNAGGEFDFNIRDFDDHQFFVLSCCIILHRFYDTTLDFTKPLFWDIPSAEGYMKHYRILYNADFMEIIPTPKAKTLTREEINHLMDSYDNLPLWKEKFPKDSWIMKGFSVMTLVDVTVENAVSILKSNLIGAASEPDLHRNIANIFGSIFRIPDLGVGFTVFNNEAHKFTRAALGKKMRSFLLPEQEDENCDELLCNASYKNIMEQHRYFAVSDVDALLAREPDNKLALHFSKQNIQSFILAPAVKNGVLLGIAELVSRRPKELNSVTANKLDNVLPYITDSIDRRMNELQNLVRSVIQQNYTTLHPSVFWKFKTEAENYIQSTHAGLVYNLKEIVFANVYPLYGQVDIKDSSITRNLSVKDDLLNQLNQLIAILDSLGTYAPIAAAAQNVADLREFVNDLLLDVKADTEQRIQHYIETNIYPLIISPNEYNKEQQEAIDNYFKELDAATGEFHLNRRNYERTLSLVNTKLTGIIDKRQAEIQALMPHYYERFKTDGVEHNLYIGASITPNKNFDLGQLQQLRLWELAVTAEMEIAQHELKPILPYHLDVASLILVFGTPIAIRFRMDEKHFDIDGAYNIRYEVIKKRIDKAHVKNSHERITRRGKITIVYSNREEKSEYLQYIKILQDAGILENDTEHFNIEDLQGVSGLKGIRIGVKYDQEKPVEDIAYTTFYSQLKG